MSDGVLVQEVPRDEFDVPCARIAKRHAVHIGLISPGWPVNEYPNGIVTYVHSVRTELMNQGHRVSVFAGAIGRTNKDSGIYLIKAPVKYQILRKLSRFVQKGSYDLSHWGKAIAATVNDVNQIDPIDILEMEESFGWCGDVQKLVPFPVVVRLHGPEFLTQIAALAHAEFASARVEMEGKGLRQIAAITSPSHCALTDTVSRYGLHTQIRRVIPNPMLVEPNLRLWDLDACDRKTILFVGQFSKVKGGDTVLVAFRRLLELDESLKLIFVGPDRGLMSKDGLRVGFDQFTNSLFTETQSQNISYLGELPRAEIFELRRRALVTLVVSRWEAQGYTALEAMIQGCPVIVTDTGGLSELVEHGVTGLLVRIDDIDDLCQKVMSQLNNPVKARQMGENARRFVTKRHSVQNLAKETVDVYYEVISKAKAGKN